MSVAKQLYQLQEVDQEIESTERTVNQIASQLGESQTVLAAQAKFNQAQQRLQELPAQQHSIEWEMDDLANKLAAEHGVSVDVLLEFGDKTPEAMETTAKRLAKAMGAKKPEADGKPPMRPYSGAGQGAGIDLSGKKPLELATMAYNQPKKK